MSRSGINCHGGLLAAVLTVMPAYAQDAAPVYAPAVPVSGTLRIWGHPYMSGVTKNWAEGFTRFHPGVRFEVRLMGSDTAVPGLYSGRADIALLGRENNVTDDNGFSRPKQYQFTRFELMNGSLEAPGKSEALVLFVHRDNPIARLTLAQLDSIVSCERRRGGAPVRTWSDVGVGGEWARQPIRVHVYDAATGKGRFFQHVVMRDSRKMNWERVTEYQDLRNYDRSITRAGQLILEAVEKDRYALGISGAGFATEGVKMLALAENNAGPYYAPSRETLIDRTYPLGRSTYAFVDVAPGRPMDPKVREFLRYVLSREGQADIVREGGYLPLSATVLAKQREAVK